MQYSNSDIYPISGYSVRKCRRQTTGLIADLLLLTCVFYFFAQAEYEQFYLKDMKSFMLKTSLLEP